MRKPEVKSGKRSASSDDTNDTKIEEPILSNPAHKTTLTRLRVFLDTYAKTGRVKRACTAAHIAFKTHYRRLASDPVYRRAFEEAEQQVGQMLEDAAVDRALAGDTHLLLALLKRFRPDAYRERTTTEHTGSIDLVERLRSANERLIAIKRNNPDSGAA